MSWQWILFLSLSLLLEDVVQGTQLTVIDTQPCVTSSGTVSRYESNVYTIRANFSSCANFTYNSSYALRISTSSNEALPNRPVVFVSRQGKGVESWTLPYKPPDFSVSFSKVNRTLCNQYSSPDERNALLYVDVFTSSEDNISYTIHIEPATNYTLRENVWFHITVGASTPQVSMFRFSNKRPVTIQAEAQNNRCAILSVQNVTCPSNDLLEDIKSKGLYQTMSTDGYLTVSRQAMKDGELLLVLITTNYSECHGSDYVPETILMVNGTAINFNQTIGVIVKQLEPVSLWAIFAPLLLYLALCILAFAAVMKNFNNCLWSPICKCGKSDEQSLLNEDNSSLQQEETALRQNITISYGTIPFKKESERHPSDALSLSIMKEDERKLRLPRMCKGSHSELQAQYSVYSWNTVTVGIFYALPAFQLVFAEQLITNTSGNQNICYYNFKCAHPVGVLSAFNNIWSNIGYIILGILFLVITVIREAKSRYMRKQNREYYDNHGIPEYYGIYYAMGTALILEGFMSALYHICPTNSNFQFDTAFMFIIGGLLLTKVFQNRHPDIHTNAFIAFFTFAIVIFFTLLGIYFDNKNPVAVRCTILILVLVMVAGFLISFYFFHNWKFSLPMLKTICNGVKFYSVTKPNKWTLLHRVRFIKLIVAFLLNFSVAVIAVAAYKELDIATAILTFFITNVVYFLLTYICTKWYYREPWTILPMALPFLIIGLWIGAFYFFLNKVSDSERTPAESRGLNKPCIFLNFYDNHDMWHFFSSWAMFCSFLFFMTLDDGVAHKKRSNIQIF